VSSSDTQQPQRGANTNFETSKSTTSLAPPHTRQPHRHRRPYAAASIFAHTSVQQARAFFEPQVSVGPPVWPRPRTSVVDCCFPLRFESPCFRLRVPLFVTAPFLLVRCAVSACSVCVTTHTQPPSSHCRSARVVVAASLRVVSDFLQSIPLALPCTCVRMCVVPLG
jgi:hypothetical protein